MNPIVEGLNWLGNLPGPVMMFVIFFVINLLLRIPLTKAFRSAFMYALGLFALSTFTFEIFLNTVVEVGDALVKTSGMSKTIVDLGTTVTPILLSNPIVIWAIPVGLLTNVVMILLKQTKTLDIDIYNILYFWGLPAVLVYVNTGKFAYAIASIVITGFMTLKVADWCAPHIHEVLSQYKGISFPYVYSTFYGPIAYLFNKLFDKVPFIRDSDITATTIKKKLGILGEPGIIGFGLGFGMAICAHYHLTDAMMVGIKLGAALYFVPICTKILIEGLNETSSVLTKLVQKHFKDREIYIGLDGVLLSGMPETLAVGLLLVPIALLTAFILPWNQVLPVGMLSVGFILCGIFMPFFKMNILKGAIFCVIVVTCELAIGQLLAPYFTEMVIASGVAIPYGSIQITNAANLPNLICVKLFELIEILF